MDIEPNRQRRNLLVISLALTVFEIGGGTVSQVSLLGGGITITEPSLIIAFAYLAMAYSLWRYWLYAKPDHAKFRELITQRVESSPPFQKRAAPLVAQFKDRSGVAQAEGWQTFLEESTPTDFKPIQVDTSVRFRLFKRELIIRVENLKGDYHPDIEVHRLPLVPYEVLRARIWLSTVASDKTFSDLYVPYLPAFFAVGVHCWRVAYA